MSENSNTVLVQNEENTFGNLYGSEYKRKLHGHRQLYSPHNSSWNMTQLKTKQITPAL